MSKTNSFYESINALMTEVCKDSRVESAWLTALGHMEDLAAKQIRGNFSASTPLEFYQEIEVHAADEERHRDALLEIRPFKETASKKEEKLRTTLMALGESFAVGYFSNPVLLEAKSRFNAYVHGALTIEQFPFQLYSAYIKATKSDEIREVLTDILSDEADHIQLGKKMLKSLPKTERLSLSQLQTIEKEMCHKLVLRMQEVVTAYLESSPRKNTSVLPSDILTQVLAENAPATCFWIHALGNSERVAASHMQRIYKRRGLPLPEEMVEHVEDEERHAKLLQQTVVLRRRKYRQQKQYKTLELQMIHAMEKYLLSFFSQVMKRFSNPDQIYLYGAWGLEMRVFKHYSDLAKSTHLIDVAHTLDIVLKDEAEHTQMVNTKLRVENLLTPEDLRWIRAIEKKCFESTSLRILEFLGHREESREESREERIPLQESPLAQAEL